MKLIDNCIQKKEEYIMKLTSVCTYFSSDEKTLLSTASSFEIKAKCLVKNVWLSEPRYFNKLPMLLIFALVIPTDGGGDSLSISANLTVDFILKEVGFSSL